MKTLTIKWLGDNDQGPKIFYSDSKRIQIHECSMEDLESFQKMLNTKFDFEGIYLLIGNSNDDCRKVYIGESDNVAKRLEEHVRSKKKEFVERYILISSKDNLYQFSKTELHYLERKLIQKFQESDFEVENGNSGQGKAPTPLDVLALDEELSLIYTALDMFEINLQKELKAIPTIINTSDNLVVEVFMKIPTTDIKIYGLLHPDASITLLANQSFSMKARENKFSTNLVKNTLDMHRKNSEFEITGDEKITMWI